MEYRGVNRNCGPFPTGLRVRDAGLAVAVLLSVAFCGCSMTRDSLLDRPTSLEQRVSVDDLADENSGFEAVHPKSARTQQSTGSSASNRQRLQTWRDESRGTDQSAPLESQDEHQTADLSDANLGHPVSSSASNRSSPFDAESVGRRSKRRPKVETETADEATATDSPNANITGDERSLFE